jgi:peptidoglycan/LPS O-acetylase OafA/YrhL
MQIPGLWRLGVELYLDRIGNLGAYFFGGCCMFLFADRISLNLVLATVLPSVAVLFPSAAAVTVALWVAIPYFAISFGLRAPHIFSELSGYDYSYGIYIYAFPVQQAVTFLIIPDASQKWLLALSISIAVTCVLAMLSWILVERPALTQKRRLVSRP